VHWPSTARRGRLMVKELEDGPRDELALLLDCAGAREPFEVAVRSAGSILLAHERRGRRAALVVNAGARRAERDFASALELLASVRPDPAAPVEELLAHDAARATELIVVTSRLPRALVHKLLDRRSGALVYVDAAGAREPELLRLAAAGVAVVAVRPGDDLRERLSGAIGVRAG